MWRWRWKEARARAIENWFSIQCKIKFDTSRRRVVVAFLLLGSLREWLAGSWLWQERRKRCYCWHEAKKYMQCTSIVQYGLKMTQLSMEESWKNRNIDELSSRRLWHSSDLWVSLLMSLWSSFFFAQLFSSRAYNSIDDYVCRRDATTTMRGEYDDEERRKTFESH